MNRCSYTVQRSNLLTFVFATMVAAASLVPQAGTAGEIVSRLIVVRVGNGDAERSVVALGRPASRSSSAETKGAVEGLLARELIRQAVLIAARDELGLATRDEVIGDRPVEDPGGVVGEVVSDLRKAPDQAASTFDGGSLTKAKRC